MTTISPCPSCGGASREAIAPGFWRCTSIRTMDTVTHVPDPQLPLGAMRPLYGQTDVMCSHEYHEGPVPSITPACACGIFAIGLCRVCDVAACGYHSGLEGGRFLCASHLTPEKSPPAAIPRLSYQDQRAHRDALVRARGTRKEYCSRLCHVFLVAMTEAGNPGREATGAAGGGWWISHDHGSPRYALGLDGGVIEATTISRSRGVRRAGSMSPVGDSCDPATWDQVACGVDVVETYLLRAAARHGVALPPR